MTWRWPPRTPTPWSSSTGRLRPSSSETHRASSATPPSATSTATSTALAPRQDPTLDTSTVDPSKWEQFRASFELFQDPILCAVIAGGVLGFLSVYVVLRRMVFVSAATTQAAGLGVALAFFAEIHLGMHVNPTVGSIVLSLLATLLLMADPSWLKLTRESVLGLAFAFAGG